MKIKEENRPTEEELCNLISSLDYYHASWEELECTPREVTIIGFMAEYFIHNKLCVDSER